MTTWSLCKKGEGGNVLPYKAIEHFKHHHPDELLPQSPTTDPTRKDDTHPVLLKFQWPQEPDGLRWSKCEIYLISTAYGNRGDFLRMFSMEGRWLRSLHEDRDEALVRFIEVSRGTPLAILCIDYRTLEAATIPLDVSVTDDGLYAVKASNEEWESH